MPSLSAQQSEVVTMRLQGILSVLRAQYMSYQTSHWQAMGQAYYGNHLLFQRLYESVQAEVDAVAEKAVGYLGADAVELVPQVELVLSWVSRWSKVDDHHMRGLQSERDVQAVLQAAYDSIKAARAMTLGLDDWIMATANAHDTNAYLLQQVVQAPAGRVASLVNKRFPRNKKASTGQECHFYKANDGKWYMGLSDYPPEDDDEREYWDGSIEHWYGPFSSFEAADKYLSKNFANPGGSTEDDSGRRPPPRRVTKPHGSFRAAVNLTSAPSDSGAPSAEGAFRNMNPKFHETRQFAETGAITNSKTVAQKAAPILDISKSEAKEGVNQTPPTTKEILRQPGGKTLSTLNRALLETVDPKVEKDTGKRVKGATLANWTYLTPEGGWTLARRRSE